MVITEQTATWLSGEIPKVQIPSNSMIGIAITNPGLITASPRKAVISMEDTTGVAVHHHHLPQNRDLSSAKASQGLDHQGLRRMDLCESANI
jgi:hypothetical protein